MLRKLLYTILVFLIFLVVAESAARLFEMYLQSADVDEPIHPGWQAEFFGEILDWHEPDPFLLWRFKANLDNPLIRTNSRHLLGSEFQPLKPPETFRIMILGDSSPVGLGLKSRSEAFDTKLRQLLQKDYAGVENIEIINAAVPGYTSEQIKIFCEREAFKYDPDLVILYCGNNDASISGYYSDRELLESQNLQGIRDFFSNFALYRVTGALFATNRESSSDSDLKIRVTPEQYLENLERIHELCLHHGCPLIILKPPVPYLWPAAIQFKIFAHMTGKENRPVMPEKLVDILGRPIAYCDGLDLINYKTNLSDSTRLDNFAREAINSMYKDSMTIEQAEVIRSEVADSERNIDPVLINNASVTICKNGLDPAVSELFEIAYDRFVDNQNSESPLVQSAASVFLYNEGIAELSHDIESASTTPYPGQFYNALLDSALQSDYLSLRIKEEYWKDIDKMTSKDDIAVVDLPSIFELNGGETLFIDHCHPTAEGHTIIADELYKTIENRFAP